MADRWRWIIVPIATLITLTACEPEDLASRRALDDYCRGALSMARTQADTVRVIERNEGWAQRGAYCAEVIGRARQPIEAKEHAR